MKILFIILLFARAPVSHAMESEAFQALVALGRLKIFQEELSKKMPSLNPSQIIDFIRIINSEVEIGSLPVINDDSTNANHDFGYSFVGLGPLMRMALGAVSSRYHKTRTRPIVGDLGAGHGIMSWKFLAAGGYVMCVEKQKATALSINSHLRKAKPFIDKKFAAICRTVVADVLDFESIAYQNISYEITWSGNLLHLFTPSQAESYVKNLFKVTQSGGYTYASVQTPSTLDLINFILNNKNVKKREYPGYILVNRTNLAELIIDQNNPLEGDIKYIREEFEPVKTACTNEIPQVIYEGSFENKKIEKFRISEDMVEIIHGHMAVFYFEENSLRKLFESAGFIVDEIFYESHNEKLNIKFGPELIGGQIKLSIVAHKP